MHSITATSSNIFIRPIDKPVSTLLIPPKYAYKSKEYYSGIVTHIGKDVFHVNVGDEVAYPKDGGTEIEFEGEKYIVIKPGMLIAVV